MPLLHTWPCTAAVYALLYSKNADTDSKKSCHPLPKHFCGYCSHSLFLQLYSCKQRQRWADLLSGCRPNRHVQYEVDPVLILLIKLLSSLHSTMQEEGVYWKLFNKLTVSSSVWTALVWQLKNGGGDRESDRKWEIVKLGKRNGTPSGRRSHPEQETVAKKPYLVTLFPAVLTPLLLSLLYLINNTKFPRLNVYIKILYLFPYWTVTRVCTHTRARSHAYTHAHTHTHP